MAIGLIVASTSAGPFSNLFVFGDSLSDVGNVAQGTNALYPLTPRNPGQYYYNGRFSNGPVYAEALAAGLGLPTLTHSRSDGTNYAHGSAKTTGTAFPNSLVVLDIDDQVTDYLADTTVSDPNALYVVFAGASNLIEGQTTYTTMTGQLATDIGRLINDGARKFLVFNMPPLGNTPRFNSTEASIGTWNDRSSLFNGALNTALNTLETNNPAITLFRFDTVALFSEALANPSAFGLTNVTASAAPGLAPGATSYNTNQIVAHPEQYLFWDDIHPTATAHAIVAQRALALVSQGDFNWDGVVDAADYVMWRRNFLSTENDYNLWAAGFSSQPSGGGSDSATDLTVPEPAALTMALIAAAIVAARRQRSASAS